MESIYRNDMQQEVVRAGLVGLRVDWSIAKDGGDHDCKLEIERLQIDNQLPDAAHPVVLCIAPSVTASSYDAPAVAVSLVGTNDFLHIRRCSLHLQPLTLNADWMFVCQVHNPVPPFEATLSCNFYVHFVPLQLVSFCPGLLPPSATALIVNSSSLSSSILNAIAIAAEQQRVMQVRANKSLPIWSYRIHNRYRIIRDRIIRCSR